MYVCCVQVTGDGSLNCADNPGEQEAMVAQLLYCEAVSALLLLRPGGSFILKTFTTLESHTLCLMFLLACCFNEVQYVSFNEVYTPYKCSLY